MMKQKFVKVELKKDDQVIQVLPGEDEILRNAGLLKEDTEEKIQEPEQKARSGYQLPILTKKERQQRIRQAKKLVKAGYSLRAAARKLSVSHTCVLKWKNNKWKLVETSQKHYK